MKWLYENGSMKWLYEMALWNGSMKWLYEMALWNGSMKWLYENGSMKWVYEMALWNGRREGGGGADMLAAYIDLFSSRHAGLDSRYQIIQLENLASSKEGIC
jgi:hypothetical protein